MGRFAAGKGRTNREEGGKRMKGRIKGGACTRRKK